MKIWVLAICSVMASFLEFNQTLIENVILNTGGFSFVVAGLLMTLIFLLSVYGLVQLVMMYVH